MKVSRNRYFDKPAVDGKVLGVLTGQVPVPKKPEPEETDDDDDSE